MHVRFGWFILGICVLYIVVIWFIVTVGLLFVCCCVCFVLGLVIVGCWFTWVCFGLLILLFVLGVCLLFVVVRLIKYSVLWCIIADVRLVGDLCGSVVF